MTNEALKSKDEQSKIAAPETNTTMFKSLTTVNNVGVLEGNRRAASFIDEARKLKGIAAQ